MRRRRITEWEVDCDSDAKHHNSNSIAVSQCDSDCHCEITVTYTPQTYSILAWSQNEPCPSVYIRRFTRNMLLFVVVALMCPSNQVTFTSVTSAEHQANSKSCLLFIHLNVYIYIIWSNLRNKYVVWLHFRFWCRPRCLIWLIWHCAYYNVPQYSNVWLVQCCL